MQKSPCQALIELLIEKQCLRHYHFNLLINYCILMLTLGTVDTDVAIAARTIVRAFRVHIALQHAICVEVSQHKKHILKYCDGRG